MRRYGDARPCTCSRRAVRRCQVTPTPGAQRRSPEMARVLFRQPANDAEVCWAVRESRRRVMYWLLRPS